MLGPYPDARYSRQDDGRYLPFTVLSVQLQRMVLPCVQGDSTKVSWPLTWIAVSMTVPTPAMQLPFWWFYAALPVAFSLIAIVEAAKILVVLQTQAGESRP